jgi:uncharacterized protein (DUF427 family)
MTDTATRGQVRVERSPKRVRGYVAGHVVVDSVHVRLVWEKPYYPTWYFPVDDVAPGALVPNGKHRHSPSRGDADLYDLVVGGRTVPDAAARYPNSPFEELRGLVTLDWGALDSWFEEDEEVFVHPRSPYTRVDILPSSRHVEIVVDGVTVAETRRAHLLFETGMPVRYYIPKVDVRMDLLTETDSSTQCPYKGTARYWSVHTGDTARPDLAWSYPTPLPESERIAGLVSFYNEKVDVVVDGVPQERPKSPFR